MEAWLKGRIRAIAGTGFVRSTSEQRSTSDVSTMLSRITDPIAKAEFRASFLDKLRFLDEKTKAGNTLDDKIQLLSPKDWEAISVEGFLFWFSNSTYGGM